MTFPFSSGSAGGGGGGKNAIGASFRGTIALVGLGAGVLLLNSSIYNGNLFPSVLICVV